jgi:flagellar hook-length control protein FliK
LKIIDYFFGRDGPSIANKEGSLFPKVRSAVPSVASEAHPILPPRPHAPSSRSHSEPDTRQPATPFVELLDSPGAAEPPASHRQARSERPERNDRATSKEDRGPDAKPAEDIAQDNPLGSADTKAAAGRDAKSGTDTKDDGTAVASTKAKDGDSTSADAGDKSKTDADSLAVLIDATTPSVAAPQTIAVVQSTALTTAADGTAESEALAALQAAGGVAPNAMPKSGHTQGDKSADAAAKAGAPADPQAGVPQIDAAKDGQARGNGGKATGEFHRAAADILTKPEASAPAQQAGDPGAAVKGSAEAVQNLGLASPANSTTNTANAATQPQTQAQAATVPLSGLAVEITTRAHAGNRHFEIRLDPPELGRIDVKLDVDRDGNVSTRLVVDRADTLDLLKRDASALERALQQSGLKTSDNALEFSLRQQSFAHDDTGAQTGAQLIVPDDDPAPLEAMRQGYGRLLGLGGGLDIRV